PALRQEEVARGGGGRGGPSPGGAGGGTGRARRRQRQEAQTATAGHAHGGQQECLSGRLPPLGGGVREQVRTDSERNPVAEFARIPRLPCRNSGEFRYGRRRQWGWPTALTISRQALAQSRQALAQA